MWWGARWAGKGLSIDLLCSSDGLVSFKLLPRNRSVCSAILGIPLPHGSAGVGNRVGLGGLGGNWGCGRAGKGGRGHGKRWAVSGDGWRVTRISLAVTETMAGDGAGGLFWTSAFPPQLSTAPSPGLYSLLVTTIY